MNDKIAIYLRLSLADGDLKKGSKDESNSIENQRMLLHDYIGKQEDLFGEIVEYVDDGYTGTNFNRPAFQKMIVDLKQGDIKVIMVKDLSRLGRDYIGVGDYIEQIFPLMGVRFIAVNNTFDSPREDGEFRNLRLKSSVSNYLPANHQSIRQEHWQYQPMHQDLGV